MGRRNKHSSGAEGLPLLERNEKDNILFLLPEKSLPNQEGQPRTICSPAESLSSARLRFRRLFLPIFRGYARLERAEKSAGGPGDVIDGRIESVLVRLGWCVEAADLPDELQRGSANLFLSGRWFKVEERSNVSTHFTFLHLTL